MPEPTTHRNALPIGHQLQEYRLQSLLGHGGFGITYLAHDTELEAQVAIKEYLPNDLAVRENDYSVQPKSQQDADEFTWGLERFIQEARTLARFKHPNIVRVLRFFRAHNTAYIVMDYEQGRSLAAAIKEGETAEEAELMSLLPPLLDGLKTVHEAGYLHRDIKPSNIYLRDSDNSPVLIDFGSARYEVGSRSRSVTTIVSPGYSPFEQYQSDGNHGPWSDIYALGAVLYRTIGGKTPLESTKRIDAIIYNKPDPLKPAVELGQRRYSKPLLEAIDWALRARETERPQNVTEFKTAIFSQPISRPFSTETTPLSAQSRPQTPSRPQSRPQAQPQARPHRQPPPPPKSSFFKRAAIVVFIVMLIAAIGLVGYPHWQQWRLEQQQIAEQKRLEEEEARKWATPGNIFRDRFLQDGTLGPKMVVIPAGRFQMGNLQGGGGSNEQPVHWVSVERFAMSQYEITKSEFRQFVNATGYKTDAETGDGCYVYKNGSWDKVSDANWRQLYFSQDDNHPVACISWNDATAYAEWLSQQTGQQYRLPTEAEWEYAARAGTTTSRYWGNDPNKACRYANVADKTAEKIGIPWADHNCTDGYAYTAPVGRFKPNAFGLFDMIGNLWEWTCSEYEDSYTGKELRCVKGVGRFAARGASWNNFAWGARSANRNWDSPTNRYGNDGVRLARMQ
jgi:formylglycine-generating enzyme required for sulfatase activity/serine/threonine protein kinase